MRRILIALGFFGLLLAASPARAQNCVVIDGVSTCYGISAQTVNNLGATSTDGFTLQNQTPATAGTQAQISPRMKWCGTADNTASGHVSETDCMFIEVLPATAGGTTTATMKFGYINPSGTVTYPATLTSAGLLTTLGALASGGNVQVPAGSYVFWVGRAQMNTTADGLLNLTNQSNTGAQFNFGTAAPTATTCGTGAPTSHSSNIGGEITATGATTCTVTFGAPNWTNQPFCTATDETTAAALRISAISVSAFTVTGLTSGDKFMYTCNGGI